MGRSTAINPTSAARAAKGCCNGSRLQPRIKVAMCGHMVTTVGGNDAPLQPNIATRVDKTNSGDTTIGIVANYQFTGDGRPDAANPRPCSEVVLMVDIAETTVFVRAFNTTLSQELDLQWGYPITLP